MQRSGFFTRNFFFGIRTSGGNHRSSRTVVPSDSVSLSENHTGPFDQSALVSRIRAGEQDAVAELYDRFCNALFGVAYRIVRSRETAEDLLQESFVQIWSKIDSFDPDRGALYTWMSTIVRNSALDYVRSRAARDAKKNSNLENSVDAIERQNPVSFNPDVIGLDRRVDDLEKDLRDVVRTLYYEGCTHREAAEELEIPIGTVKTRVRKAISVLRDRLLPMT